MTPSRRARLPRVVTSAFSRLVTIALLIGVFGALATHHADDATASAANGDVAAMAAMGPLSANLAVETATETPDASWLVAGGCAALALCCVVGLVISQRASRGKPAPSTPISVAPRDVSVRTPSIVAPIARPSLLDLSVSRT